MENKSEKIYKKNKERREAMRLEMLIHGPYNLYAGAGTERQLKQVKQ